MIRAPFFFATLVLISVPGCTVQTPDPDGGRGSDAGACAVDGLSCVGRDVVSCTGGVMTPVSTCMAPEVCAPGIGCASCIPGYASCEGADTLRCRADGSGFDFESTCPEGEVCYAGGAVSGCTNACAAAAMNRSNLGCEYWAVDLDNEYASTILGENDAAGAQFAVVLANPSDTAARVTVEVNDAPLGSPPALREVFTGVVRARNVLQIDLPKREVDGSTPAGHSDGPGTFVSSNAYRVTTDFPVVAYQFNPIIQQFSNDASLLIASTGLDTHYRVLGWPTANPIAVFPMPGLPDHSFVTIVGIEPGTEVTVTLGGAIVAGGSVPATAAGGTVTATLGPFDVLNLESDGIPGDLTGTVVTSSAPVAVFSGGERGIAPIDTSRIPLPPGGEPESVCCTDHLEEQVFPTSAWGSQFVLTHSPVRSNTSWVEPDIYRIIADRETTTVTTNLEGEDASFTLAPGAWHEFYAQRSIVLSADHPVSIEQILVSQQFLPSWRPGAGGDPTMTLFPPYEQFRERYVFLTPTTFTEDYVVVALPEGASVIIDGLDVQGDEFQTRCTYEDAGLIEGVNYIAATCTVEDGPHELRSDQPVGLMVYGYYNVGSYGYAAGTNLERINVF
jgi:hypothetical protein